MMALRTEQRSPAEAQGRGDNRRGGALSWRHDVCQGPVTLADLDNDCYMTRWYVRGVGVAEGIGDIVAEVDVSGQSAKPHYYLYNHRGDVLVVLNPDGAANSTFRYDAFGNYYQMTGPFTPRYTFSTKEYLPAAGLYLYQYRAYDPIAGRWTQRDPIDYHDSINLYQFCGNNPVNITDADGRFIIELLGGLFLGALVGLGLYTEMRYCDEGAKNIANGVREGNQEKINRGVNQIQTGVEAAVGAADAVLTTADAISHTSTARGITKTGTDKVSTVKPTVSYNKSAARYQTNVPVKGKPGRPFVKNTSGTKAMEGAAASTRMTSTPSQETAGSVARRVASDSSVGYFDHSDK